MPQSRQSKRPRAAPWTGADELARRASLTEILARVSREALNADGLDATLKSIVDCLVQRLPVAIASIILLDDEGTHFVREVWAGDIDLDSMEQEPWPVTRGASGRCARTGVAQLIDDVGTDPDYVAGNPDVRSEYLVPIRHREHMLGVLNLESKDATFFTPYVRAMFDAVADQIAGAIHLARVVRELEDANRRLRHLSMVDGLTSVANRRAFDERLDAEWHAALRARSLLALLLIDADCFKLLNDHDGHLYGDDCLRMLARLCSAAVTGRDHLVARYGGEELVVLLPQAGLAAGVAVAQDIRRRIALQRMPHATSPVAPYVTVSIGVAATRPIAHLHPASLVAAADRALYAAKAAGRNQVVSRRGRR